MENMEWTAVKVFSATKARERDGLGDRITDWMRNECPRVITTEIRQSSDNEFHCLSIICFYQETNGSGRRQRDDRY